MDKYEDIRKSMREDKICEQDIEMVVEKLKQLTEEEFLGQMNPDSEQERKRKEQIKQAKEDREKHTKAIDKPYEIPMLWIRDKSSGRTHLYGTDSHDSLCIGKDGGIHYYNLQNGDGTGDGGVYEFVDHDTEGMMYDQILHYYCDSGETT